MSIGANIVVGFIALLHIYILVLEMFLWDKPAGLQAFCKTKEEAMPATLDTQLRSGGSRRTNRFESPPAQVDSGTRTRRSTNQGRKVPRWDHRQHGAS